MQSMSLLLGLYEDDRPVSEGPTHQRREHRLAVTFTFATNPEIDFYCLGLKVKFEAKALILNRLSFFSTF